MFDFLCDRPLWGWACLCLGAGGLSVAALGLLAYAAGRGWHKGRLDAVESAMRRQFDRLHRQAGRGDDE